MKPRKNWTSGENHLIPHTMGHGPIIETAIFPDNVNLRVMYRTKEEVLRSILPPGIELVGEPVISFIYRHSEKLDWLINSEQNSLGISVNAIYNGKQDQVEGDYIPVLWENDPMAVILGREIFGVPKLCADITNPICLEDSWRVLLSEAGRPLIEIEMRNLQPVDGEMLDNIRKMGEKRYILGWKQVPSVDSSSAELTYATHFPIPSNIEKAWSGEPKVTIFETDPDVNMWTHPIVSTIRNIPLEECLGAILVRGPMEIIASKCRALK